MLSHSSAIPPAGDARPRPHSLAALFMAFTWLSLQGFGGVLAVVQHELVERRQWLTNEEFIEEWAVAQLLPGPNVVNIALMIGSRYFGFRGALAALGGMLLVPLALLLVIALVHARFADHPGVAGALRGMSAVAAGLIIATGLKLAAALRTSPLGPVVCTALAGTCFMAVALLRWPLAAALIVIGLIGCLLAYRKIAR